MTDREQAIKDAKQAHAHWLKLFNDQLDLIDRLQNTWVVNGDGSLREPALKAMRVDLPPDWDKSFPEYSKIIDRDGVLIG